MTSLECILNPTPNYNKIHKLIVNYDISAVVGCFLLNSKALIMSTTFLDKPEDTILVDINKLILEITIYTRSF